ncbi:SAV_915 family protein [Actinomadura kijaniata]|uniref:SAV_915 family protein n=1 Tax=Actinomadura kijaniata TaxID=46161 RepID=UPI003F1E0C74
MGAVLIVPVRECAGGTLSVRTGRMDASGERVGIAFSDEERARAAFGAGVRCVRLSEPALRALLGPVGVARIRIDPVLVAGRAFALAG